MQLGKYNIATSRIPYPGGMKHGSRWSSEANTTGNVAGHGSSTATRSHIDLRPSRVEPRVLKQTGGALRGGNPRLPFTTPSGSMVGTHRTERLKALHQRWCSGFSRSPRELAVSLLLDEALLRQPNPDRVQRNGRNRFFNVVVFLGKPRFTCLQ